MGSFRPFPGNQPARTIETMIIPLLLAALTASPLQAASPERRLPFTDAGWATTDPKARIETLGGREALRLTSALSYRRDLNLADGTIEFDLWSTGERAFAYILFRMKSDDEFETVYFRLHKSRLPDAIQYDPFYQRLGNWQLFHGPDASAAVDLPAGRWIHVKLELLGEKAALFVGASPEPVLAIPKLARGAGGGYIALRSFLGANIKGDVEPPTSFTNVVVRPGTVSYDFSRIQPPSLSPLPGLVTRFRFSPAFVPGEGPVEKLPETLGTPSAWPVVNASPSGLVVIGAEVAIPKEARRRYASVASFHVRAAEAGVRRLRLGFSDEVTVYLNGQILYYGDQHYSFNFPRQEGLIHLDQALVYLPLKKGDNEVRLVISEVFGGWGLMAQFPDPSGLMVEP